jgi:hypothetical protein
MKHISIEVVSNGYLMEEFHIGKKEFTAVYPDLEKLREDLPKLLDPPRWVMPTAPAGCSPVQ